MNDLERSSLIEAIAHFPIELERSVEGLTPAQLDEPYREGGWSARQVVHHVADSHMNAFIRMRLVLTEEHPTLKPYDQDAWARLSDLELPLEPSLAIVWGLHERWSAMLRDLPEEAWSRTAFHPEDGEVTMESLLRNYARHGVHHAGQILDLRKRMGW